MINIKTNSKKVKKGDTFIALRGIKDDGHKYISEAIKRGASKIICEYGDYKKETIIVNDTKKYLNEYLYKNFYEKIKNIKIIGITGTNGKTTSAYLLYQALNFLNIKTAYIGTIGFYIDDKIKNLDNTTPELIDIYEMLLECKSKKVLFVIMEVSSHSLELDRLNRISFDYAIFTNLTSEHLDFHKTMENYALAKKKLFLKIKDNGYSIINIDDEYYKTFINGLSLFYGFNSNNYKIIDYQINNSIMIFRLKIEDNIYEFRTKLLGKFNIYNIISTIIVLRTLEVEINKIIEIVEMLSSPVGRNEIIEYKSNKIIIDYAHTPDAIEKILITAKEYTNGKIYSIIGCGGNRDTIKRPIIGEISSRLSNYVIITNDNPRYENENNIIKDIVDGIKKVNYIIIPNRKKAIIHGISLLDNEDSLLILGKGHETYQIINGKKKKHDDHNIVLRYIRKE